MQSFIRFIAFVITFGVGAGALTFSALCNDLILYFSNKQQLALEQQQLLSLEEKVQVYDALLKNIKTDDDVMQRIAPAVLGLQSDDPNTAYPLTGLQELEAAREMLQQGKKNADMPVMPPWLIRCSEQRHRTTLFLAGGILVLTAFACFGLVKPNEVDE
ncbi:MAG: hypothetical protein K9N55_07785 [Phycisphaerae bacterium]|nr:hypothetical protein [Phycisphaerae bacterium]